MWILRLLGRRGNRVEADVGEKDDGAAGEHSAEARWRKGHPVALVHQHAAHDEEERNGGNLDGHHDVVDLGRLAHAAHQQPAQDHDDEKGRHVEVSARPLAVSPYRRRPSLRQDESELCELRLQISGKADADGYVADRVFQNQIPADDPGKDFAERGIAIRVGRTGDGDHRGQLGVTEPGEGAGDSHQDEADGDGRAGGWAPVHQRAVQIALAHQVPEDVHDLGVQDAWRFEVLSRGGRAGKHENARADDGADSESGQRPWAQGLLQAALRLLGLRNEAVNGLTGKELIRQGSAPAARPAK